MHPTWDIRMDVLEVCPHLNHQGKVSRLQSERSQLSISHLEHGEWGGGLCYSCVHPVTGGPGQKWSAVCVVQ